MGILTVTVPENNHYFPVPNFHKLISNFKRMQTLFLGTSSGWPIPRLGCNCNICTSPDPKDKRLRPSVLINEKILIDAPPDIYHELKVHNVDATQITHIALTHAHDDHIMGLYDLTHIYNLKFKDPRKASQWGRQNSKINLVSTKGVLAVTRKKMGLSLLAFRPIEVKPFEKFEVGQDTSSWFIPVEHPVEAYGIKIKAPKPAFYAVEFRKIRPSSRKQLGDLDLAIIDGSSKTHQGQAKGHETIEEGVRFGKEIRAKKILFTNIGHKTDIHEKLDSFVKEKGGDKFGIAFDGLEVRV